MPGRCFFLFFGFPPRLAFFVDDNCAQTGRAVLSSLHKFFSLLTYVEEETVVFFLPNVTVMWHPVVVLIRYNEDIRNFLTLAVDRSISFSLLIFSNFFFKKILFYYEKNTKKFKNFYNLVCPGVSIDLSRERTALIRQFYSTWVIRQPSGYGADRIRYSSCTESMSTFFLLTRVHLLFYFTA